MLRDLWIGGALGIGLYWWRHQTQRIGQTAQDSKIQTEQLGQELEAAKQALSAALTKCTSLETQVAELNQLATDRMIELIQLQADNADLMAQVSELSQKRTRKKRVPKVSTVPQPLQEVAAELDSTTPFSLDIDLIQAKKRESDAATQLLQSVFREELPASKTSVPAFSKLDAAHTEFLHALRRQSVWRREDLVKVAQQLDLLLDGALELINEAAFDCCDEPLAEGEDPLEINPTVLQELLS